MADILHRVGIKSSLDEVYQALTAREGLAAWWTNNTQGESKVGGTLRFRFSAGGSELGGFDMKVLELQRAKRVLWQVVDGPQEWIGTKISFDLKQSGAHAIVLFKHQGWKEPVEFMHHCSTKWATYLMSLKSVSLTSRGHRRAAVDFDDPNFQRRPYDKWIAYGQSKTANALFAVGLDARTERHAVRAFSVHPGAIVTDLMRSLSAEEKREVIGAIDALTTFKNTEQGAATSVWCAISPQLDGMGGVYCEDVDIAEAVPADFAGPGGVRPWATDPVFADQLWTLSEKLTGVIFEDL